MPFLRKRVIFPTLLLVFLVYIIFESVDFDQYQYPSSKTPPPPPSPPPPSLAGPDEPLHWHKIPEKYPVTSFLELPGGGLFKKKIPKIQFDFPREKSADRKSRLERRDAVKDAFLHAWTGYKENAWLKDEVAPISGESVNSFSGWAASLVDTLDTLWIMDLKEEFKHAVKAIEQIDFTITTDKDINVFETTIRYVGGLLAAHDLSDGKHPILLQKAQEIGDFLYRAFDTPNRMHVSRWDWRSYLTGGSQIASSRTLLAEVGSLSLEFTRLTQLTGDPKYFDAIQRVTDNLDKAQSKTSIRGLWPIVIDLENLYFRGDLFTLGGMADSTYEYLPKEHLLLGGNTDQYRRMYEKAIISVKKWLLFRPMIKHDVDILFSGTLRANNIVYEAQHLTCFVGGMFGIGAKIFNHPEDLEIARQLTDGCIWAYDAMETGLMPEVFKLSACSGLDDCPWDGQKWLKDVAEAARIKPDSNNDNNNIDDRTRKYIVDNGFPPGMVEISDGRYILRPEAIESVYILYRITGDKAYQDAAWRMFSSIEKLSRTEIAHAGIKDVRFAEAKLVDKMESFWMAETLKYFYLIFSEPELVSLDEYVLNTEAHPFKRPAK